LPHRRGAASGPAGAIAGGLGGVGLGPFLVGLALLGRRAARSGRPLSLDSLKQHYRGRIAGSPLMKFLTVVSNRDSFALLPPRAAARDAA